VPHDRVRMRIVLYQFMGSGSYGKIPTRLPQMFFFVKGTGARLPPRATCFRRAACIATMLESISDSGASVAARLDAIDRQIPRSCRMRPHTNVELAWRRVGISSAPPCLRRVRALEEAGFIMAYRALLRLSFSATNDRLAMVHLPQPFDADLAKLRNVVRAQPPRARMLDALGRDRFFNPQMRAPDFETFQAFRSRAHRGPHVRNVKTSRTCHFQGAAIGGPDGPADRHEDCRRGAH